MFFIVNKITVFKEFGFVLIKGGIFYFKIGGPERPLLVSGALGGPLPPNQTTVDTLFIKAQK